MPSHDDAEPINFEPDLAFAKRTQLERTLHPRTIEMCSARVDLLDEPKLVQQPAAASSPLRSGEPHKPEPNFLRSPMTELRSGHTY